ncbi:MAG: DUF4198 domain-containing protein [Pseudomonadota bacterium]
MLRSFIIVIVCVFTNPMAHAHEFWIAPLAYQVNPFERVVANFHVGQDFKGPAFPFVPRRRAQTLIVMNGVVQTYAGMLGDRPALQFDSGDGGLMILAHETKNDMVTYRDWEKFTGFAQNKDFPAALARHAERGLPQTGFRETYRRYAKSLVAVGRGAGADQRVGFDIEIVALGNPYTTSADHLAVQLWYQGLPWPGAQVEIFAKSPDQTVVVTQGRTNANGVATIAVKPNHTYMIDAVALEERDGTAPTDAVWHSLWANLTFYVPE